MITTTMIKNNIIIIYYILFGYIGWPFLKLKGWPFQQNKLLKIPYPNLLTGQA